MNLGLYEFFEVIYICNYLIFIKVMMSEVMFLKYSLQSNTYELYVRDQ